MGAPQPSSGGRRSPPTPPPRGRGPKTPRPRPLRRLRWGCGGLSTAPLRLARFPGSGPGSHRCAPLGLKTLTGIPFTVSAVDSTLAKDRAKERPARVAPRRAPNMPLGLGRDPSGLNLASKYDSTTRERLVTSEDGGRPILSAEGRCGLLSVLPKSATRAPSHQPGMLSSWMTPTGPMTFSPAWPRLGESARISQQPSRRRRCRLGSPGAKHLRSPWGRRHRWRKMKRVETSQDPIVRPSVASSRPETTDGRGHR